MKTNQMENIGTAGEMPARRKLFTVAGIFAAAAALVVAGYIYYMRPVNYVSIDINPSVEIALNAMNRVVGVEAANQDGAAILENARIRNRSVESAVQALVQNAVQLGYVAGDGSTVIAVMSESENGDTALKLQEQAASGVALAMQAKNAYSAVCATTANLEFRNEAKEMCVSPGKYRLIKMLQAMDPSIDAEQYRNAKVSEIVKKAGELAQNGVPAGNLDEPTMAMVRKAQAACGEMEQNQVRAAEQNRMQEQDQNQNQNGAVSGEQASQNQEQEQNQNQNGGTSGAQTSLNQEQEQNQNGGASGDQTSQNREQEQNQNGITSGSSSSAGGNDGQGGYGPGDGTSSCTASCSGSGTGTSSCSASCSGTGTGTSSCSASCTSSQTQNGGDSGKG